MPRDSESLIFNRILTQFFQLPVAQKVLGVAPVILTAPQIADRRIHRCW
jgi:hypothetical protein